MQSLSNENMTGADRAAVRPSSHSREGARAAEHHLSSTQPGTVEKRNGDLRTQTRNIASGRRPRD